jgi:hypothetical protein
MATADRSRAKWLRVAELLGVGVAGTLALAFLLVLPSLVGLLPETFLLWPVEWSLLALLIAYGLLSVAVRLDKGRISLAAQGGLACVDGLAGRALRGGLALAVGAVCLGLMALWVPQYLTWPWARDADTFATLALSWDRGILPYREIISYNFPGHIYLFWIIGKVFGWGRTIPLFAVDVTTVVLLGVVATAWSRRRLGGLLPGLFGFLAFLSQYLNLAFEKVAQRDWHTMLGVVLSLMVAQAWPSRRGRLASALFAALGSSTRPHVILFLPALLLAVDEGVRRRGERWRTSVRAIAEWCGFYGLFLVVMFTPVLWAGVGGDFVRRLKLASYGGPYSRATPAIVFGTFWHQLLDWRTDVTLGTTVLLAVVPPAESRRVAQVWILAWLGALVYGPIHPVQHAYLCHAVLVMRSITLSLPVARLVAVRWARPLVVLALLLVLHKALPELPRYCDTTDTLTALPALARGKLPAFPPQGSWHAYVPDNWRVYQQVLDYLRHRTGPNTVVANVLNRYPYESLNGPTGRLSPFHAESGICWMMFVNINLDAAFAESLEKAEDSVVVWEPSLPRRHTNPRLKLDRVFEVIRLRYEPEARFDNIEVWRRKRSPGKN